MRAGQEPGPTRPHDEDPPSPYVSFDRDSWRALAASTPLPLTQADVIRLRGVGETIELDEVDTVHRPLSRLLHLHAGASRRLHAARQVFLHDETAATPYVIGIAGSVAVGKSTFARILAELMARWPDTPSVALVPTDGFLYPNAVLAARGLMARKGFPESYDRRALLRFLAAIKSGVPEVEAPVYSHVRYDILPGQTMTVRRPDILIIEGLNVLQPAPPPSARRLATAGGLGTLAVSDFFDFSIYLDARECDVRQWYIERFLALRRTSFAAPDSFFQRYATLHDDEARATAGAVWDTINAPNLVHNIAPTRTRATLILAKGPDHRVKQVHLRKV
ncbi:MAG: type I pantothenate kinase [Micrococcales bacterium]|nr:type I pantothenate kinase [Micrococcales bacterium]